MMHSYMHSVNVKLLHNKKDLELLANEIEGNLDSSIKVARKFKVKIEE